MKTNLNEHLKGTANRLRILRFLNNSFISFKDPSQVEHNWRLSGIEGDTFYIKSDNGIIDFEIDEPIDQNFIDTIIRFGYTNLEPVESLNLSLNTPVTIENLSFLISEFNALCQNLDFGALTIPALDTIISHVHEINSCIYREEMKQNPLILKLLESPQIRVFDELLVRFFMAIEAKLENSDLEYSLNETQINHLEATSSIVSKRLSIYPLIIPGTARKIVREG